MINISYHILLNHIKPCSILHHHCRRLYLDLDRAWMSVHELRQVIDFAVQCHPAILWDAMAVPQWKVTSQRSKHRGAFNRWKMEILEVTPHVHTLQTFFLPFNSQILRTAMIFEPRGLNRSQTQAEPASLMGQHAPRQVDKSHLAQRDVPRDRHGGRLLEQPLPGQAALETLVDWNWRNDWIELEWWGLWCLYIYVYDVYDVYDVYGFLGSAFFLAFIGFTWFHHVSALHIDCFQTSWILRDVEGSASDPGERTTTIHQQVFGCIMMYLGILRFWDLETIITKKKNEIIYLTYLENPSPGKEMQWGRSQWSDKASGSRWGIGAGTLWYSFPSCVILMWTCQKRGFDGQARCGRVTAFPGAITFIPRTSYSTLSS